MLCCLLAIATSAHAKSEIWLTGTFSSLRFNTEGRDLLGVELKIVPTRKGYHGALQIAEGGPSEMMVVDVAVRKNNAIRFDIPASYPFYGGGTFEGTLDSKGITGRFTFGGVTGDLERLVRGRSYWDTPRDPGDVDKSSVVSHSSPRHRGPEGAEAMKRAAPHGEEPLSTFALIVIGIAMLVIAATIRYARTEQRRARRNLVRRAHHRRAWAEGEVSRKTWP
jgi:hypothetical protein